MAFAAERPDVLLVTAGVHDISQRGDGAGAIGSRQARVAVVSSDIRIRAAASRTPSYLVLR